MKGVFELKKQVNSIGLYCIVELEVETSKTKGISISYDLSKIEYFKIAIEYGIRLALESLVIKGINQKTNHHIKITKFQWTDVDTSLNCVSYASCRAIYNAFKCESKMSKPTINELGDFIF